LSGRAAFGASALERVVRLQPPTHQQTHHLAQ
jgi:hypothetical protein